MPHQSSESRPGTGPGDRDLAHDGPAAWSGDDLSRRSPHPNRGDASAPEDLSGSDRPFMPSLEIPAYEQLHRSPLGKRLSGADAPDPSTSPAAPVASRLRKQSKPRSVLEERHRKRRWLRVAAIVAALIATKLVVTDVATLRRASAEATATYRAVVATKDLPLGHLVEASDLRVVTNRGFAPPDQPLSQLRDAEGKVLVTPVLAGTPLQSRHVVAMTRGAGHPVPNGSRAVAINASVLPSLGPGSVVDIWATSDDPSTLSLTTNRIISSAIILDVTQTDAVGQDFPAMLTVLVPESDVPTLVQAVASASLVLVEAPPEAACCNRSFSDSSKG